MTSSAADSFGRNKTTIAAAVGGVLVLAIGAWLLFRPAKNTEDTPQGFSFICKSCDHRFNVSTREFNKFRQENYGQRFPCPKCKSTQLVNAHRCDKCSELYPVAERGEQQKNCPKCGAPPPLPKS